MNIKLLKFLFVVPLLAFYVSLSCFAANETRPSANNFNVVFVIDGSGSILSSDKGGLRYEAIDLFLALLPNSGNNVGGIVFDDTILEKGDVSAVNGIADKKTISNMFRYTNPDGFTDIGLALNQAVEMLNDKKDSSLPSVIILLSDGNTLLSNKSESTYTRSESFKSSAIHSAQQNGYKVYSVCLNSDGKASIDELLEISNATNGKCFEINTASDLKAIFSAFYSLIYSSETTQLINSKFPDNGIVEKNFSIPSVGVDELNILIESSGKVSHISLMQPSGVILSDADLANMTISGNTFSVTKIQNPLPGEWTLTASGIPNESIIVEIVLNTDISFISQLNSQSTSFSLNDRANISAQITSKGVAVSGLEIYDDYKADLILKNGSDTKELAMTPSENGYSIDISFDDYGTYYATPRVVIGDTQLYGETYILGVGNTAPSANTTEIQQSVTLWPFGNSITEIDLSSIASDREDAILTFSVTSSDGQDIEYSLAGAILTIDPKAPTTEKFTVTATDSLGLSCSFDIVFTAISSNRLILDWALIFVAVIVVIVMILLLISSHKRFDGQIYVQVFNDNDAIYEDTRTAEPIRGKCSLKSIILDGQGVKVGGSFFQATGKGYITFKSSKAFYVSGMTGKQKKCDISGNIEITISPEQDLSKGIRVTFLPNDYLN